VTEEEASWGGLETVLALAERFPECDPELLVSFTNEVVCDNLF
jgi:hypothetical protein